MMKNNQHMKKGLLIAATIVLLIGGLLYSLAPHPPRPPTHIANVTQLEAYLQDLTASEDPPGLSVAVVQEGELIYSAAFGYADGINQVPASTDTVYHWWSLTKMATAAATLRLAEEGQLTLDDPVRDHLSYFEVIYPEAEQPPITIRHLLNHTSGLPDTMPAMIGWVNYNDIAEDQTALLQRELPNFNKLRFTPGRNRAYTNLGYMVLGAIIEASTGERYESIITAEILQPLGMTNTAFIYSPDMAQHEAVGSHPVVNMFTPFLPVMIDMDALVRARVGTRYWFNRFYIDATPPTGLIGSAVDAARLVSALAEDDILLTSASLALMRPNGDEPPLGWAEFDEAGDTWVQHRGGGPGFATIMRLYPAQKLGIVITANGTNLESEKLAALIATLKKFTP